MSALSDDLVQKVDNSIQQALASFVNFPLDDTFLIAGAMVFLPDEYSQLLEPAFDTQLREYSVRQAVLASYGTVETVRADPEQASNRGIATWAFQDGRAYSCDPNNDHYKFGPQAAASRRAYGINGSMLALRLSDSLGSRLGVLVVYTRSPVPRLDSDDAQRTFEEKLYVILEHHAKALTGHLQRRRQVLAERDLARYNELAIAFLKDYRTVKTAADALAHFRESLKKLLPARDVLVHICSRDDHAQRIPQSLNSLQQLALEKFSHASFTICPHLPGLALNRSDQREEVFHLLAAAFKVSGEVYGGVVSKGSDFQLICVVSRKPNSISDHWLQNDLSLLQYACHLLCEQLARCNDFQMLLSQLSQVIDDNGQDQQFNFLCHLLREFFSIDQVLIAEVAKQADTYEIKSRFVDGFGDGDKDMRSRPKKLKLGDQRQQPQDVMEGILDDFCYEELRAIYRCNADTNDDPRYPLDKFLISTCNLRGQIYFLPCCLPGEKGNSRLKGILHLGRRDGTLTIADETIPFLNILGQHVAQWRERTERLRADQSVEHIRNVNELNYVEICKICSIVSDACRSLGCTLFLSVRCLALFDHRFRDTREFVALIEQFCSQASEWNRMIGVAGSHKLEVMISSFLGLEIEDTRTVLRDGPSFLAPLLADSFYFRVAQSNAALKLDDIAELIQSHKGMRSQEAVRRFAQFLIENAYLPGFGLTGWVLFNRCPMLIANKEEATLSEFAAEVVQSKRLQPISVEPILRTLKLISAEIAARHTASRLQHADHISEDPSRSRKKDTYAAYPLEDIEDLGSPIGLVRISNSASLREAFGEQDDRILSAAAQHISSLLRRHFMAQESRLNELLVRQGRLQQSAHFFDDLYKSITYLNETLERIDRNSPLDNSKWSEEAWAELQTNISRLKELAEIALGTPDQRILAYRIVSRESWEMADFSHFMHSWLHKIGLDVEVKMPLTMPNIKTNQVLLLLQLAEEVAKNYRAHQEAPKIAIHIHAEPRLMLYVDRFGAIREFNGHNWLPYENLCKKKSAGGGMKLIRMCSAAASVDYSIFPPIENRDDIVVRLLPLK